MYSQIINSAPILVVPLQSTTANIPFNATKTNNTTPFYDDNDRAQMFDHTGTYTITASSVQDGTTSAFNAFNAGKDSCWKSANTTGNVSASVFDISSSAPITYKNTYHNPHFGTSYYNSTAVTAVMMPDGTSPTNIYGEWLQIELPVPIFLYRYAIRVPGTDTSASNALYPSDYSNMVDYLNMLTTNAAPQLKPLSEPFESPQAPTSHFPKTFVLAGSRDGANWSLVDQRAFSLPPDLSYSEVTFDINSIDNYTYYRVIISELFPGNSQAQICQLSLYAYLDRFTPNPRTIENFTTSGTFGTNGASGIRQNYSPQYVTDMDYYKPVSWDYFSKGTDIKLIQEQKKQRLEIEMAKQQAKPVSNLGYFTVEPFYSGTNTAIDDHSFQSKLYNNPKDVANNQVAPMIAIYNDYLIKQQQVNQNYFDLSKNIYDFSHNYYTTLADPNDTYDLSANNFNRPPTKLDGLLVDNKEIIMQQNSMYILSTITIATLVLALILVTR